MGQTEAKTNRLQFKFVWPITIIAFVIEVILITIKDSLNPATDELTSLFGFLFIITGIIGVLSFVFWLIWIIPRVNIRSKKIGILVGAFLIIAGFWNFIGHPTEILGTGITGYQHGDQYFLCKICKSYKRFDVVAYQDSADSNIQRIGRIVGLPNENIQLSKGTLLVNASEIKESYADWSKWDEGATVSKQLNGNEYLILLDERFNKEDNFKNNIIAKESIIGGFPIRIWPLNF